jgi:uncharacterized protein YdiU (UPF0061 family)
VKDLLALMANDKTDFTILFRRLSEFSSGADARNERIRDLFLQREAFDQWADRYKARLLMEGSPDEARSKAMKQVNPKYILRNYLAEIAIRKAEDEKDYSEIGRLLNLLRNPFDEQPEYEHYAGFPPDWAGNISVSCSS